MAEASVDTSKKADGGGGVTLDKVLAKLDSISARQDALEKSHDDSAAADGKGRKDGDLTLEHEGSEKKEGVQGGETPPVKMDKKAKADEAAKKAADAKALADAAMADAAKAKADWDNEDPDKDKKDDAAKKAKADADKAQG